MQTKFDYYYNEVPGKGKCRNNLVYTSLISSDKKTFCQWYYNDPKYHRGENKVIDKSLMEEKWKKEVYFLLKMQKNYPQHIPQILDIDYQNKKIFLQIDGEDLWQQSCPSKQNYKSVLADWEEQMLEILEAHKNLKLYKMSLHPSSYFVVNGKLKSINYFFTYNENEKSLKIKDVLSHISEERLEKLYSLLNVKEIDINDDTPLIKAQHLAFDSFKNNFPESVINKMKNIYV